MIATRCIKTIKVLDTVLDEFVGSASIDPSVTSGALTGVTASSSASLK